MIISRQKNFSDILRRLNEENKERIFIIGCGKCASLLKVGGEPEVRNMKDNLERSGKKVVGFLVQSTACSIASWDEIRSGNPGIREADAILVMSCGCGVSIISGHSATPVYPALDTGSLGGVTGGEIEGSQYSLCSLCGDCNVDMFGGVCPIAACPKGMLNGPCGGSNDGRCEIENRDCAWAKIYERLKRTGRTGNLSNIMMPKDHSKRNL